MLFKNQTTLLLMRKSVRRGTQMFTEEVISIDCRSVIPV